MSLEESQKWPVQRIQLRDLLPSDQGRELGVDIIDDELWRSIETLLPPPRPRRSKNPGRIPISNRAALSGILLALRTGIRWCDLPAGVGYGSGTTCWRRFREWEASGVAYRTAAQAGLTMTLSVCGCFGARHSSANATSSSIDRNVCDAVRAITSMR